MQVLTLFIDEQDEKDIDFVLSYVAAKIKKGCFGHDSFPVKWKMEDKDQANAPVFIFFRTDLSAESKNRKFLGVFDSPDTAYKTAVEHNYILNPLEIDIVKAEINRLKEI